MPGMVPKKGDDPGSEKVATDGAAACPHRDRVESGREVGAPKASGGPLAGAPGLGPICGSACPDKTATI